MSKFKQRGKLLIQLTQPGINIYDYVARWEFDIDSKDSSGKHNGIWKIANNKSVMENSCWQELVLLEF